MKIKEIKGSIQLKDLISIVSDISCLYHCKNNSLKEHTEKLSSYENPIDIYKFVVSDILIRISAIKDNRDILKVLDRLNLIDFSNYSVLKDSIYK